jgi:ferredoxin-NADP reductase
MAETAWQAATIVDIRPETATAKSFRLRLGEPSAHRPGQHYIIRLTAPDGYTASRSYSIASAPDGSADIELTIERLPDGEVSSFLHDEASVGDELEVRGPIGGWFIWTADRPALLIGGGSGVVPLMAMLRYARRNDATDLVRVIASVRRPSDLYYPQELPGPETTVIYTRTAPMGETRPAGRITPDDLQPILPVDATVYICGSAPFADAASDAVMALSVPAERIRVERFGPS